MLFGETFQNREGRSTVFKRCEEHDGALSKQTAGARSLPLGRMSQEGFRVFRASGFLERRAPVTNVIMTRLRVELPGTNLSV